MTIYVDAPKYYAHARTASKLWSHMATDADPDELHAFAKALGLQRRWYQNHALVPHYDIVPRLFRLAQQEGAILVETRELINRCRIDGKRTQ